MKLNKFFLGLLGGVALMAASCSGEDHSIVDDGVMGVYFSNELPTQYEISPDANTCNEVFISRLNASEEQTVSITTEQEDGSIYSIPESVTFPAGEKTVALPINYDPAQIEYGKYETITIKVGDPTTPYGISVFSFKIGVTDWSEWKPWNVAGTADYYYSGVLFTGDDPDLPFTYRQNVLKPNLYQFKLEHWGYDVDLIWDYDAETGIVSCPFTYTGYTHSTYGPEYAMDYAYYMTEIIGNADPGVYGYFDEEQGILACPIVYYDTEPWGVDFEYIYIDGYSRADYSAELVYSGIFINAKNETFAVASLTLGADATGAKAVVVDASLNASEVAAAIAAGEIEATDVEAGRIEVPIAEDQTGKLQIVAVVIEGGEIMSVASANFKYEGAGESETWKSVGTGDFTYSLFFGDEDDPFVDEGLELLQSETDPTRYKIEHWGYDVDFVFTMDENGNILVDDQETGYIHSQYGAVFVDDLVDYTGGTNNGVSSFDAETNTFNFAIVYYVEAGIFGYGIETFKLNPSTEAKSRSVATQTTAKNKTIKKVRTIRTSKMTQNILRFK